MGDSKKKRTVVVLLIRRSFKCILLLVVSVFVLSTCYMASQLDELMMEHRNNHGVNTMVQDDDGWSRPYIHVINTRFMQQQGHLIKLTRARIVLFQTFCLPSMLHQSVLHNNDKYNAPPFLWIIKTDPDLNDEIRQEMIQLLQPYPYIYLVGSNVNYGIGIHPGGWRGGQEGRDVLKSTIHTGNMDWLQRAHAARNDKLVLETRLDADDGLHVKYLQSIQEEAVQKLKWGPHTSSNHRMKWRYWCALNHLEWSPTPPLFDDTTLDAANATEQQVRGIFVPRKAPHVCITPGLTLGLSVGETEESIPRFPHEELYKELRVNKHPKHSCGHENQKCLRMVNDPFMSAIRSRTPTSAGMKDVASKQEDAIKLSQHAVPVVRAALDKILTTCFAIPVTTVIETNTYVKDHLTDIVKDNLQGQCTHGHSCKNSTKDALHNLLDIANQQGGTNLTQ